MIQFAHLSEAQKRAYLMADNQLALKAGWDEELLAAGAGDLSGRALRPRPDRLRRGRAGAAAGDRRWRDGPDEADDEVPEPLPSSRSRRPGDLWVLGNHRLLCGDATVLADVERVLGGQLADMTFSDPPYNVDYANSPKDKLRGKHRPILNDDLAVRLRSVPVRRLRQHAERDQGRVLHLHEQLGAAHAAARFHGRRRQVVDLRHLGQEHLHPRPQRLSKAI